MILNNAYDLQDSGAGGSFAFRATASDALETTSVGVTINATESRAVPDNSAPVFDQPGDTFDVSVDAADGAVVSSLAAMDPDGHSVRYSNSDPLTFGLDSEVLTFHRESSATDRGFGSQTDECQEHSVLLDGSCDNAPTTSLSTNTVNSSNGRSELRSSAST